LKVVAIADDRIRRVFFHADLARLPYPRIATRSIKKPRSTESEHGRFISFTACRRTCADRYHPAAGLIGVPKGTAMHTKTEILAATSTGSDTRIFGAMLR
jgi:hypothetical protein